MKKEPKNKKQKNGVKNTLKKLGSITPVGSAITAGKFIAKKLAGVKTRGKAKKKKKMNRNAANRRDRAKVKG